MANQNFFIFVKTAKNLAASLIWSVLIFGAVANAALCWTHNSARGKLFASPLKACEHAVFLFQGNKFARTEVVIQQGKPTGDHRCYATQSANDNRPKNDFNLTLVTLENEPHCKQDICGPYGNIPDTPAQGFHGAIFSSFHRAKVVQQNFVENVPLVRSDILGANSILMQHYSFQEQCQKLHDKTIGSIVSGFPNKAAPRLCYAVVHHIIPRLDTNGCPCGSNSNRNALVISNRVNGLLSNQPPPQALLDYVVSIQHPACNQAQNTPKFLLPGYFYRAMMLADLYGIYFGSEFEETIILTSNESE